MCGKQKCVGINVINILMILSIGVVLITSTFGNEVIGINQINEEKDSNISTLRFDYSFPRPKILQKELGTYVMMSGLDTIGKPGEPVVPHKTIKILVPQGKEVTSIDVSTSEGELLSGNYNIAPGQQRFPLSYIGEITPTEPNPQIYNSLEMYPGKFYNCLFIQKFRGFEILVINLFPIQYKPQQGEVYYYSTIDVILNLCPQNNQFSVSQFRNLPQDAERIINYVENPGIVSTYMFDNNGCINFDVNSLVDPSDNYDYVIITNETLKNANGEYTFQNLIDSKEAKGLNATIVTVEEIVNCSAYWVNGTWGDNNPENPFYESEITENYERFNDSQAKIRNFIRDAFLNWNTTFILLGGDGDGADVGGESEESIIPSRSLSALGGDAPSDLYYAALDGNYNYDQDSRWGEDESRNDLAEIDEADLLAEVFIGRAPVDCAEEISNFVMKNLIYEQSDENPYIDKLLLVGEFIGFGGEMEFGGYGKDEIYFGTDSWGHETAGIPHSCRVNTLYDRDGPMREEYIDISSFVGYANTQIRFRLESDDSRQYAGFYLDDVEILGDGSQIFFDNMENGENGWTHSGENDDWELGTPTYGVWASHSGENCWGTNLNGIYQPNSNQSLISPFFNLSGVITAQIHFYRWFFMEPDYYDNTSVEISVDNGNNWEKLKKYTGGWEKTEVIDLINDNVHIINHLGHGNNYHIMKLDHPVKMVFNDELNEFVIEDPCHDIDNLSNEQYFFGYSQACLSGAFDNWYPKHSNEYLPHDSIVEHLITSPHGAFAFIANTRFGIGAWGTTNASSQHFDREFFDELFGENNRVLGEAHQYAKEDCIGLIDDEASMMRYVYYELTLFGDPEIKIKGLFSDANGPYTGDIYEQIQFNGSASGGSPPYSWHWDFGDGNTSDVQKPIHNYSLNGIYNVTLTVTDSESRSSTDNTTVLIYPPFIRGDVNTDGDIDMSDAIYILKYLYVPDSPTPPCKDSADADDNGAISFSDAIYILKALYAGGPQMPPPYPNCGPDPTPDNLNCEYYPEGCCS